MSFSPRGSGYTNGDGGAACAQCRAFDFSAGAQRIAECYAIKLWRLGLPEIGRNSLFFLDLQGWRCCAKRYREIRFDQPFDLRPGHHIRDKPPFRLCPLLEPFKPSFQSVETRFEAGDQAQILFPGPD